MKPERLSAPKVLCVLLAGYVLAGAGWPEPLPFHATVLQSFASAAHASLVPVTASCGPCQCVYMWRRLRLNEQWHALTISQDVAEFTGQLEVLPPCRVRVDLAPWIHVYPRPWETNEAPQSGP